MNWSKKNTPTSLSRQTKISEYFQVSKSTIDKGECLAFEQIPNYQSEEYSDYSEYDLQNTQDLLQDKESVLMINTISNKTEILKGLVRNYRKFCITRHKANMRVNVEPVIDWIIQTANALGYQRKTIHNSCAIFHKLLSVMDFQMTDMHLACLTSIWISAKLEEYDQYDLSLIMSVSAGEYSSIEICEMEVNIYHLLTGLVSCVTYIDFLYPLLSEINETESFQNACLLSDLVLFLDEIHEYTDPEIAAGIISIILTYKAPFQKLSSLIQIEDTHRIKDVAHIILNRSIDLISTDKMYKTINGMLRNNKLKLVTILDQAYKFFNN